VGLIHNLISRGELNAALKRALGVTKDPGGLERFSETLTPIIHLWGLPEWAYLRQEVLVADSRQVAAGAATTRASYGIINPDNSGMIVVIEALAYSVAVAAAVQVGLTTAAGAIAGLATLVGGGSFRDTRWARHSPAGVGRAIVRTGLPVGGLGVQTSLLIAPANSTVEAPVGRGIVLGPGTAVVVQNTDDAADLFCAGTWRERQAYPGELV